MHSCYNSRMEQNNRLFMPFSIVQSNPVVPKSKEQIFLFRNLRYWAKIKQNFYY